MHIYAYSECYPSVMSEWKLTAIPSFLCLIIASFPGLKCHGIYINSLPVRICWNSACTEGHMLYKKIVNYVIWVARLLIQGKHGESDWNALIKHIFLKWQALYKLKDVSCSKWLGLGRVWEMAQQLTYKTSFWQLILITVLFCLDTNSISRQRSGLAK